MKKTGILVLLLAAALFVGMSAALAFQSAAGVWYMTGFLNPDTGEIVDPSEAGLSITYTLNRDGTGIVESAYNGNSTRQSVSWSQDGAEVIIVVNGNENQFKMVDSGGGYHAMVLQYVGVFQRDYFPPAMQYSASSESAFYGEYLCTGAYVEDGSYYISVDDIMENMGTDQKPWLRISPGKLELEMNGEKSLDSISYSGGRLTGDGLVVEPNELNELTLRVSGVEMYFSFYSSLNHLPGDADMSRETDIRDALRLLQSLSGRDVAVDRRNADVNGDGEVDLKDAMLILQYDAGWSVTLR